jgi:hypothetical protein
MKSTKAKPRGETATPSFRLTETERMFLAIYSAMPMWVRAELGESLFECWTRRPTTKRVAQRFDRAMQRFHIGPLGVDTLDDMRHGRRFTSKRT